MQEAHEALESGVPGGGSLLALLDRRPGAGDWDDEIAEDILELAMSCIRRQPRMR